MKTTVDLPDNLFRKIKSLAAREGFTMRQFITQALLDRLGRAGSGPSDKPWMKAFGGLSHIQDSNAQVLREIEREFGTVNPEDWS